MTAAGSNRFHRNAFITGASGGIGRAVCERLLERGWNVWGTARDKRRLVELTSREGFSPVEINLSDLPAALLALEHAEQESGGFHLYVNNAGYGQFGRFDPATRADLQQQLDDMIGHTAALIQEQVASLRPRSEGVIVNVSSLATEFPLPFMAGYNMAKAALSALSESLGQELAGSGVTVIDFRPGDVKTNFNQAMAGDARKAMSAGNDPAMTKAWQKLEAHIECAPSPDEIAPVLVAAVERGKSGVVRAGGFFQARVAPLQRLLPESVARSLRRRYFGLS